jgi:hypothetical protein
MGRNKRTRKRIDGLDRRIRQHEEKIAEQKVRGNLDLGTIRHWEIEIRTWRNVGRLKKRLPGKEVTYVLYASISHMHNHVEPALQEMDRLLDEMPEDEDDSKPD